MSERFTNKNIGRIAGLLLLLAGASFAEPPGDADREKLQKEWRERAAKADPEATERKTRERLDRILSEETSRERVAKQKAPPKEIENEPPRDRAKENRPPPPRENPGPPPGSGAGAAAGQMILYTVLILLGAVLLVVLVHAAVLAWRNRNQTPAEHAKPRPSAAPALSPVAPPIHRDPEAWLADARRLAAAGRYAEALRCLLFAAFERLHRARLVDFERARTNREVLSRFRGAAEQRVRFASLVNLFDASIYSGHPAGAAEWGEAEGTALQLLAEVSDESVA